MKISIAMLIVLTFGFLCLLVILGGAIAALAYATVPLSDPSLYGAWFIAVLFGAVTIRILPGLFCLFRHGAMAAIDETDGVSNLKDKIGPIAWSDICGASIHALGATRGISSHRVLFVEVPDAAAERYLHGKPLWVRSGARTGTRPGLTQLPIMGYPPYAETDLKMAMEKILSLARGAP